MKISKLFHWLYASVMLLPLMVAPIFAIYMHRHQGTDYSVTTGGYEVTEIYQTNEVNGYDDLVEGNIYHADYISFDGTILDYYDIGDSIRFSVLSYGYFERESYDYNIYELSADNYDSGVIIDNILPIGIDFIDYSTIEACFFYTNVATYCSIVYQFIPYDDAYYFFFEDVDFIYDSSMSGLIGFGIDMFDYSMPTASSFQSYDIQYNEGLTYSDTDIGSQFTYSVYLTLNKYFNVTNFIGLNNLYTWINTNVFAGTAGLGFQIFYMLLSYWLMVSIFWLVFDVAMYVPNLAHRWLDKGALE